MMHDNISTQLLKTGVRSVTWLKNNTIVSSATWNREILIAQVGR